MRNETNSWREACIVAIALLALLIASISTQAQRKLFSPGLYEGESLVNSGKAQVNGGSVAAQPMSGFGTGWSGNAQLFWGGGSPGAVLDLTLDVAEEGIYEIELHMTKAPDFGRLRIQVENKNVGERFDGYASSVTPSGPISLGTFALHHGPAKVSLMIDGKNVRSSNYFAGIDFIRLNKKQTQASKILSADGSGPHWHITSFSVTPEPSVTGPNGTLSYMDKQTVAVKCSYEPDFTNQFGVRVIISDINKGGGYPGEGDEIKDDVVVNQAGTRTKFITFHLPENQNTESRYIGCFLYVRDDPSKSWESSDLKWIYTWVIRYIIPKDTKWPDAPIIQTPIQNGKITVKAFDVSASCTDGGSFLFEFRRAEEISPGHWGGNWQPLKFMWKPLACLAEGSTKDISGTKPGHYQVRARLINGKYKFDSDWSEWTSFDIPEK